MRLVSPGVQKEGSLADTRSFHRGLEDVPLVKRRTWRAKAAPLCLGVEPDYNRRC